MTNHHYSDVPIKETFSMMNVKNNASTGTLPEILEIDEEAATNGIEETSNQLGDETGDGIMANRPHPSLDYPPIYFALKRWPWLSRHIKPLYQVRWSLSYPLQRKLPYSKSLRKLGITASWGEVLLFLPFVLSTLLCVYYTVVEPDIHMTGVMARYGLIAAVVFGQKNSLLTLLLGIPFDRALFYHKAAGYNAFVNGLLHTWSFAYIAMEKSNGETRAMDIFFANSMNVSGTLLLVLLTSLLLSSIQKVRHVLFEVFYYFHLIFVLGMVCSAYFHSGPLIPCLAFLTTGVDMFIRKVIMAQCRYPKNASIKTTSDSVVEIRFPKLPGFDYNPGQYIYIAVPELSWLEFHPFSISSSPKQSFVTLHIRRAGNWTNALHMLAQKKTEICVLLEGPYGNLSVDLFGNDRYKHVVLVCGGIGLTPMQSICNQLLYEHSKGRRNLETVKLVWVERDPVLMKSVDMVRHSGSIIMSSRQFALEDILDDDDMSRSLDGEYKGHSVPLASTLLSMVSPSRTTDMELEELYESQLNMGVTEEEEEAYAAQVAEPSEYTGWPSSSALHFEKEASTRSVQFVSQEQAFGCKGDIDDDDDHTSVASDSFPFTKIAHCSKSLADVLDLHVHLSGRQQEDLAQEDLEQRFPFIKQGRPKIAEILSATRDQAADTGHRRVAVLVCSPPGIAKICKKACIKLSDQRVRFDYHEEGFG